MAGLRFDVRSNAISVGVEENKSLLSAEDDRQVTITQKENGKVDVTVRLAPLVSCPVVLRDLPKEPEEIVVGLQMIPTQYGDGSTAKKLKITLEPDGEIPDCCVECDGRVVCGPNACIVCDNGLQICCFG